MKSNILKTEYRMSAEKREYFAKYKKIYRENGLDKSKRKPNNEYHRNYYRKMRDLVFEKYGARCVCCGEFHIEFLSIDHIEGGGRKHRKLIGGNFYMWLIKNNFPKGFRVLCHNCNMSLGMRGYCPHLTK